MTSASMTFGRPARLKAPRGALWFGSAAAALLNALRSADRWLLDTRAEKLKSAEEVLEWARRIEPNEPSFAADLRAAALRSMGKQDQ